MWCQNDLFQVKQFGWWFGLVFIYIQFCVIQFVCVDGCFQCCCIYYVVVCNVDYVVVGAQCFQDWLVDEVFGLCIVWCGNDQEVSLFGYVFECIEVVV